MGGCCSTEDNDGRPVPPRAGNIGPPQDLMLHVPRPRMNSATGQPYPIEDYELSREDINRALSYVAEYLNRHNEDLTIIGVGGIINTVYLQTRASTHDVDFCGTNLNNTQRKLLDRAAHHAMRQFSRPLGSAWLNNETTLHMAADVHRDVTARALAQNEIIFRAPGLSVIAAPFDYAFASKAQRVGTEFRRSYDVADCAIYLHEWRQRHGNKAPSKDEIDQWCRRYRRNLLSKDVLRQVQIEYRHIYGASGIAA